MNPPMTHTHGTTHSLPPTHNRSDRAVARKPRTPERMPAANSRPLPTRCRLVGILLTAAAPLAQANLVVNGSFESPDVPAGSTLVAPTPTGWSSVGPQNTPLFDHPLASTGNWPGAQDGDQYAALLGGTMTGFPPFGSIDMSAATGLRQTLTIPAAGEYVLSWHDNAAIGVGGTPYAISIAALSGTLSLPSASAPLGATAWHAHSFSFTIGPGEFFTAPGSYSIEFRPTSIGVTLLDGVRLDATAVHGVPDSGTSLALLGSAVGGLGLLRRRRRMH